MSADRGLVAALAALALGGVSMFSPPLALLGLAALAARVLLSGESVRINWLQLGGPALAALIVGAFAGLPGAIGTLFVWRLIADTSWSSGEAARLAAAAGRPAEITIKALAHAWMTPLYGLMLVAYTAPHMIAGMPLDLPHVPSWLVIGAGVLAAGAFFDWGLQRAADWRLGELARAPAAHLFIHHVMFVVAFGLMIDVSAGVVMMMAWRLAHAAPLRQPN
ncbi:MAG: hypothetical protein JNL81_03525 [Hyphomonadaceae bacterium]|nr:hypothetical protein [Hyphomonadaceae bacterium]